VSLYAKAGKKIDAFYVDPLLQDQLDRQHGIQTAGDQGHCFSLGCFSHINCAAGGSYRERPDQRRPTAARWRSDTALTEMFVSPTLWS